MTKSDAPDYSDYFFSVYRSKKNRYVKQNEVIVAGSDSVVTIDLGTCASAIMVGYDGDGEMWIGANHLFKSRDENSDLSLTQLCEIVDILKTEKNCIEIACLGLFGAAYRKDGISQCVAQKNVMTLLETLSLFDMTIEVFKTGYRLGIVALYATDERSFFISLKNLESKETEIVKIKANSIFKDYL